MAEGLQGRRRPGKILVFAGPTLPPKPDEEWQALLGAVEILPPAQRGDVLSALCREPSTLVILDGIYYTVPAVTHKEILYALSSGVRVIGAASMGALRSAEMEAFGMEGVGEVFRQFRDGVLEGDDEVAVLHADEEHGFRPLTLALVDVRSTVEAWVQAGRLSAGEGGTIVDAMKALPFTERHGSALIDAASEPLGKKAARELLQEVGASSLKQRDAKAALMAALGLTSAEKPATRPAEEVTALPSMAEDGTASTIFSGFFFEWHLRLPPGGVTGTKPSFLDAWNALRLLHPQAPQLVERLRRRFLLASAARRAGLTVEAEKIEELAARLRRRLVELHGQPLLPFLERQREAEDQALAEAALAHYGSEESAIGQLAEAFGLSAPRGGAGHLLELITVQEDLLPAWNLVRGAAGTTAFREAAALAAAAKEIHEAFQVWSKGSSIDRKDLAALAQELWSCGPNEISAQARARGLFESRGFSPGLWAALELLAPAERLPRPLNEYPRLREALLETELGHPLLDRLVRFQERVETR